MSVNKWFMPRSAPRPCGQPGCKVLLLVGSRCDEHRRQAYKQQKQAVSIDYVDRNRFYQRKEWKAIRSAHLMREPLCRLCLAADLYAAAVVVDHIDEIADGGDLLDDSNLQSLCKSCHNAKTMRRSIERRKGNATIQLAEPDHPKG